MTRTARIKKMFSDFWKGDKYMLDIHGKHIIQLVRHNYKSTCTRGEVMVNNVAYQTLEPPHRDLVNNIKPYCVAEGLYPLKMEYSKKFDEMLPELKETGDIAESKFHVGNWVSDTLACILPGLTGGETSVSSSRKALDKICAFVARLEADGKEVFIQITSIKSQGEIE